METGKTKNIFLKYFCDYNLYGKILGILFYIIVFSIFFRLSPPNSGINGSGPRRKQARPRRRSGDSVGNSSLDLSKSDSPLNAGGPYNAHHLGRKDPGSSPTSSAGSSQHNPSHLHDDATPENLSMKRPSSSPAINLVSNHFRDLK